MPSGCWRYVKSEENPADCASRGLTASQLIKHDLWWQGPSWLSDFDGHSKQPAFTTDLEMKKVRQVNAVTEQDLESNIIYQLLSKHSSISKVIRILSWVFRLKERKNNKQIYLSLSELHRAEILIIKQVQQIEFSCEIKNITENSRVHTKSKILQLNSFLDENGILRVGGRLRNSNLPTDMKHPFIIPGNSRLAELLIDQAHKASYHGGARLTSAFLRKKYWLVGGNKIIKKQLRGCVKCRHHDPIKHEQIMGDYPAARTRPARPFQHTGVDYTGFVDVKSSKGRGIKSTKGYIAVFVCMATKAVHLELVSDLSSSAFLSALRRMAARRGTPSHIYSDNGTNFVGANKVLNREYLDLQATLDPSFYSAITDMKIQWHFNAPGFASAGGLWEAAVKSLKYHLKRVIGEQKLTFEEYSTLLSQLEACLNARPLCPLTEDPEDMEYLTPAHFLASGPTLTIIETERDLRTRWQLAQKIFEDVWKKWQSEYLSQLSTQSKWRQPQENLKINDVVIIHDANLPSGKWALGRITALHPKKDDYVRVVTLKTKNGGVWSLKNLSISVPRAVLSGEGEAVLLRCSYDLEGAALYSIRWYRAETEFYRYVPREMPPSMVFPLPGAEVDLAQSDNQQVRISSMHRRLSGDYQCEVSADAPLFHTDIRSAPLTVVDPPFRAPQLAISRESYARGDVIRANCSVDDSYPAPNITWILDEHKIAETISRAPEQDFKERGAFSQLEISILEVEPYRVGLTFTSAGLQRGFQDGTYGAYPRDDRDDQEILSYTLVPPASGQFLLSCAATIFDIYARQSPPRLVREDAPRPASVTGEDSGSAAALSSALLLALSVLLTL